MPVQNTSIATYEDLEREGQITADQHRVLALITYYPDRTDQELTDLYVEIYGGRRDPNRVRPRRNELARKSYVIESGKRKCLVTGRLAYTWRVMTQADSRQPELLL